MTARPLLHGGGLHAARRAFPDAPEPWLDLSTGINPVAYPVRELAPEVWTRLPEPEDIAALEAVAAHTFGAPNATCVVAASGVQSLIQLLPLLFAAQRVAILGSTYEEHARCWRASGAQVTIVDHVDEMCGFDVAVVVNPNNPDGRIVPVAALEKIASRETLLILDESFADVMPPAATFASHVVRRRAIILRSLGKFFGLGGLRLGFAIASPDIAERLRENLGPWAVSGPAVAIGRRALADGDWQAKTRERLVTDARRLDTLLMDIRFDIVGGTPLFRLAAHPEAKRWHEHLCRQGILTRRFEAHPFSLRFGLPDGSMAWDRLSQALLATDTNC